MRKNLAASFLFLMIVVFAFPTFADLAIPGPHELPDPDSTAPDSTKPVKVFILSGQSNMVGEGRLGPLGTAGTLETLTKTDGMFPHLIDASGNWTVRNDVRYRGFITAVGRGLLTPNVWGSKIGPELGFGHIMGYYFDEPVIVMKSSQGNRSISWDIAPPSTPRFDYNGNTYAGYGDSPNSWPVDGGPSTYGWYAGKQYDDFFLAESDMGCKDWAEGISYVNNCQAHSNGTTYISKSAHTSTAASEPGIGTQSSTYWNLYSITNVTDVLDNFATEYPEYAEQGFEIAGYGWWQGNKDRGEPHVSRYELNMVNLINDLREYYENRYPDNIVSNAPFVIATFSEGGWGMTGGSLAVANAQLAVSGETGNYPEFEGNVKTVECRDYWRESDVSPTGAGYHYNGNSETFMLVGDAMGRAMAEMQKAFSVDAGKNMITWSGEPVQLDASVQEDVTVTSYAWSAIPEDGVVFTDTTIANPIVTITKDTDNPSIVKLVLTVNDGVNKPVVDVVRIMVYDDACKAARLGLGLGADNVTDISGDCTTNLADFAEMAVRWLNDNSLSAPQPKSN